jgi:hypothetical protein
VGLLNPHLDDAAIAQVWTDRLEPEAGTNRPAERHLQTCAECRVRYASYTNWLDSLRSDALSEADEAFGPDRLVAQQAQIARRLEALEHPARVIAFPRFTQPTATPRTPPRRWVAAAAAAGLIVGVGLGQVLEFGTARTAPEPDRQIAISRPAPESARLVQPVSHVLDETLLDDSELVPSQVRVPESLRYLNDITPGARDYDPR